MDHSIRSCPLISVTEDTFSEFLLTGSIPLSKEDIFHFRTVLKKQGLFEVTLSNSNGHISSAEVDLKNQINKTFHRNGVFTKDRKIILMIAPLKRKVSDDLIQKLTECGVDEIHFISVDNQIGHLENLERINNIARNTCIQCRNPFIPKILQYKNTVFNYPYNDKSLYFWGDILTKSKIKDLKIPKNVDSLSFIIGSEGGWSAREEDFLKNRFPGIQLSNNILRSETAAQVAVSMLAQYQSINYCED